MLSLVRWPTIDYRNCPYVVARLKDARAMGKRTRAIPKRLL